MQTCTPRASLLNPINNKKMNKEEQKQVADLITANTIFCTKEVLTSDEAAKYMGVSKSYLYKLTMRQQIPHYKPMGKMCYFNRLELEQWLQSNRVSTSTEISQQAQAYCMKKGGLYEYSKYTLLCPSGGLHRQRKNTKVCGNGTSWILPTNG